MSAVRVNALSPITTHKEQFDGVPNSTMTVLPSQCTAYDMFPLELIALFKTNK